MNLRQIFDTSLHDYERAQGIVDSAVAQVSSLHNVGYDNKKGAMTTIDLGGELFILDRPLEVKDVQLITLQNATFVAGPSFPEDAFLVECSGCTGVNFRDMFLECSKRANGISVEKFFRVRVEDCHIIHQKSFGIHSSATGANHELEIFKCHIVEYFWRDGYRDGKSNFGIIPEFDVDENRVSTGIFLGQADNVVADCNINLCRTGIHCGMRANRIRGNHITAGGTRAHSIFKGIEMNNFYKSSAIINDNYVDNCCLWINCSDSKFYNRRNYIHVTGNLFYRGFNHPKKGAEFSHVMVNPLSPRSALGNVHITNNLFYNQDENFEGVKSRVIRPIAVVPGKDDHGMETSLDNAEVRSFHMENNQFTNEAPTFVKPMGTTVSKSLTLAARADNITIDFTQEIPFGMLNSIEVRGQYGHLMPGIDSKIIGSRGVTLTSRVNVDVEIIVKVSTRGPSIERFNYVVE